MTPVDNGIADNDCTSRRRSRSAAAEPTPDLRWPPSDLYQAPPLPQAITSGRKRPRRLRGTPDRRQWLWVLGAVLVLMMIGAVTEPLAIAHRLGSFWVHAGAFGLAASLVTFAYRSRRKRLQALLLLFALGVAIELVQAFLPWRSGSLNDLAFNAVGLGLGALLAAATLRLLGRSRQ